MIQTGNIFISLDIVKKKFPFPDKNANGKKKYPVKRVNVDFNVIMLQELDDIANEQNISRQALIKTYLRNALDNHYLARQSSIR